MNSKILSCIGLSAVLTVCANSALAANIGDVINHTVKTDIVASINGHDIPSYNIDGRTAIVAEDLRDYGFDVEWNGEERAVNITRSLKKPFTCDYIAYKIRPEEVGLKEFNVLYTDIKTYINGEFVQSYNIDGRTIINFGDLKLIGTVGYNEAERRAEVTLPYATDKLCYDVIAIVNDIREDNGLKPLKENVTLSQLAKIKAEDMAVNDSFKHLSAKYGLPFDMMDVFGINYGTAGENIARGHATAEAVVQAWMDSEGHKANILNKDFTEIGVGYCADGDYWSQMFIGE